MGFPENARGFRSVSELRRRAWAKRATIAKITNPALVIYALIASAVSSWLLSLAFVVAIFAASILGVLTVDLIGRRRARPVELRPRPGCVAVQRVEQRRVEAQDGTFWWAHLGPTRWIEGLFVFWNKVQPIPAETMTFHQAVGNLRDRLDHDAEPEAEPDRKKAALVAATGLLSDEDPTLEIAPFDWELARWVELNMRAFAERTPPVSVFGAEGWDPYPGILVAHCVVETSDHWVVLGLRRPDAAYSPLTWSASFEEQVELGTRRDGSGNDQTIGDTIRSGISDELGVDAPDLSEIGVIAIGREFHRDDGRSVLGGAVVATVLLSITLEELWSRLSDHPKAIDRAEHVAWMACRFQSVADVDALLRRTRPGETASVGPTLITADDHLSIPVATHPGSSETLTGSARCWHPTSRPRLHLWAQAAHAAGRLS